MICGEEYCKIAVFDKRKTTFDFRDGKNRYFLIKNKSKLSYMQLIINQLLIKIINL